MFYKLLIVFLYLRIVNALEVKYIKKGDLSQNKEVINVTDSELSEEIFGVKVGSIIVEQQKHYSIEAVHYFPDLAHVEIYDIGLEFMPVFQNLSIIYSIKIKGNEITYIKKEAFSSIPLKELFISNNKISKIEPRSFGPDLNVLHLSCNQLSKFSEKWFQHPENLKELDISGNQLTSIEENLFKKFKNLDTIILSHNKISEIGNGAFSNRIKFRTLHFEHNKIPELSEKVFDNSIIKVLDLKISYNRISFLSEEFLKKVNKTKVVIYGNPWKCECYSIVKKWSEEEDTTYNYNYDYENDDYEYQYEYVIKVRKAPKEDKNCQDVKEDKKCDFKVDFSYIEEYEKNITKKTTSEQFCKKLLRE